MTNEYRLENTLSARAYNIACRYELELDGNWVRYGDLAARGHYRGAGMYTAIEFYRMGGLGCHQIARRLKAKTGMPWWTKQEVRLACERIDRRK